MSMVIKAVEVVMEVVVGVMNMVVGKVDVRNMGMEAVVGVMNMVEAEGEVAMVAVGVMNTVVVVATVELEKEEGVKNTATGVVVVVGVMNTAAADTAQEEDKDDIRNTATEAEVVVMNMVVNETTIPAAVVDAITSHPDTAAETTKAPWRTRSSTPRAPATRVSSRTRSAICPRITMSMVVRISMRGRR